MRRMTAPLFKKLSPNGQAPQQNKLGDAGYDLCASEHIIIEPGQIVKIKTGIAIELDPGTFGLILDRSSFGAIGLKVMGGVIDSNYRGEILVCILNTSINRYNFGIGDRCAQMVILNHGCREFVEANQLSDTDRGSQGFGASGR